MSRKNDIMTRSDIMTKAVGIRDVMRMNTKELKQYLLPLSEQEKACVFRGMRFAEGVYNWVPYAKRPVCSECGQIKIEKGATQSNPEFPELDLIEGEFDDFFES